MRNWSLISRLLCSLVLISTLSGCFHLVLFGSVVGTTITVTQLDGSGDSLVLGPSAGESAWLLLMEESKWNDLPAFVRMIVVGFILLPEDIDIDPENYYLVEASGGQDNDPNLNGALTDSPRQVLGSWHSIVKGDRILAGNLKVSPLSEAIYQYLKPELASLDNAALAARLDEIAALILTDITDDGVVDYQDVLQWNRSVESTAYSGDITDVDALTEAVLSGESNSSTLQDLAQAVIDQPGALDGTWSGQYLDGPTNLDGSYSLSIAGDKIDSITRNSSITGVTGNLTESKKAGLFDIAFSDGRIGHLIMLGTTRHALLVDENLLFVILELDAGPRNSYALGDLVGSFAGNGVATVVYPNWAGPLSVTLDCSMSGSQVRCNASSSAGFAYGLSDAANNGLYPTEAYDDDDDFEGNGWLMMSNDKSAVGLVFCETYSMGISSKDCGFAPLERQ
jgi:hypothetical protein